MLVLESFFFILFFLLALITVVIAVVALIVAILAFLVGIIIFIICLLPATLAGIFGLACAAVDDVRLWYLTEFPKQKAQDGEPSDDDPTGDQPHLN